MNTSYQDHFSEVNNIKMHYIEYKNDKPKMLLMHGLTANAHVFEGLIRAGLSEHFHVISIDFRGRGLSTKVAFHYSIKEHADDVIEMLDHLEIKSIILCGHSFGGLMASYLAYNYPDRFKEIIILDAAPQMNPKAAEMLGPALSRIDTRYPNFDAYIEEVKKAPYNSEWDDAMIEYYKADVATAENGSVEPISNFADIIQIATSVSKENWEWCYIKMTQKTLIIVALDDYTMGQPLLPTHKATQIVEKMQNVSYKEVSGNHQTMLFGKNAPKIVKFIVDFLS